jgi:uncharacterized membrane protein
VAIAAWAVVLLGGALRLYRLDALSYWLDEGITVYDTRREWDVVFGLHGRYAEHPPLYHVFAKFMTLFFPDNIAARVLSLITGTLTLVVLYFLVATLLNRRAAVAATLVLAVSPLHIWYSQEARMYAPTMFAVALSYLMLVLFYKTPQIRWAVGYGLALALAVYMDYSAVYALAPQVALVLLTLWKHRRGTVPLIVSALCAVVLYLPWFPQMMSTAEQWRGLRDNYLAPSPIRVSTSLLAVVGAGGNAATTGVPHAGYYWGLKHVAWDLGLIAPRLPVDPLLLVRAAILVVVVAVVAVSTAVLWRRNRLSMIVAALLLATIPVAVLSSLVSAGYAERTVLSATLGWALLVGGAAHASTVSSWPRWVRAGSLVVVALVIGYSVVSLRALYQGGIKQDWRALANATADVARSGQQILVYPTYAEILMDIYQPQLRQGKFLRIDDWATVPDLSTLPGGKPDSLAIAYFSSVNYGQVLSQLEAQGYVRQDRQMWQDQLFLDTYTLPGISRSQPAYFY